MRMEVLEEDRLVKGIVKYKAYIMYDTILGHLSLEEIGKCIFYIKALFMPQEIVTKEYHE